MKRKTIQSIADLTPDPQNANRGTVRGAKMIDDSLRENGAGRSILADKNGVVIAGNKTLERAVDVGITDIVPVHTTGDKLVVVIRDDLDLMKDNRAKRLAVADNRAGQVSLEWDAEVLAELVEMEGDLLKGLFDENELAEILERPPSFQPVGVDEQGRLDEKKKVVCPNCGHEFAPK